MAKVERDWIDRRGVARRRATWRWTAQISLVLFLGTAHVAASLAINADDSRTAKNISRRVNLDGPGDTGATSSDVVQALDSKGDPRGYSMDVKSVICADKKCEIVTVRIHFDLLGDYERYELPSGGNLTKSGHKPFSAADHAKLHQILSDPYSQLKSVGWDQITIPGSSTTPGDGVDGISGATALSKRNMVVTGAAYTCYTLWHWSHGEVVDVIRDMTIRASDKQDLLRYLNSGENKYVIFAADQLRLRGMFDTDTRTAVLQVMRNGDEKLTDPALRYLATASKETGIDCFFRCCEDESLVAKLGKRLQFLEALKESTQDMPAGCLDRISGWLARADSYYEVHLVLSLLERKNSPSEQAFSGAMLQLESSNPLVVRRSYRYLKAQTLNDSQKGTLEAFEQQHPDRL